MGLFSFFKKGKKKKQTEAELAASYDEELNPHFAETLGDDHHEPGPITMVLEQVADLEDEPAAKPSESQRLPEAGPLTQMVEKEALKERIRETQRIQEAKAQAELAQRATDSIEAKLEPSVPEPEHTMVRTKESMRRPTLFSKLRDAVGKTRKVFSRRVASIVGLGQKIDEDLLEELEEALLESDIGVGTCEMLMEDLTKAWKAGEIETSDDIFPFLKADLKHRLTAKSSGVRVAESGPTVILVVGVNGAGKTTSIAKMARIFVREGKKVLLAAGDTFRAAAVQQLVTWSSRIGCDIVTGEDGSDPASVAFKACEAALEKRYDILLIDTAGRLHTQKDLMDELAKISRVIKKHMPDAPHETIMVIDATTGQNAVQQAKLFNETADVTGVFLAKLDGTAKGGAVLTIDRAVGIPVKFVGLGETFDDVQRFNAHAFVDALFDDGFEEEA